ncbi:MAG TPA: DUF6529 family protein [Ktedonobacterales bacterium]|nr:DUF6529 family protein [Ktedonobacterales bacterium]
MNEQRPAPAQVIRTQSPMPTPQPTPASQNRQPGKRSILWLLLPLGAFAVISLGVGWLIRYFPTTQHPFPPENSIVPGFSDTIHLKVWLATAALGLACLQLITASRIYDLLPLPPKGRIYNIIHRWSGRVALLLTLPVAFYCLLIVSDTQLDMRVMEHATLGTLIYGAVAAKITLVRVNRFPGWALPVMGALLFSIILGLWLTSSYWFFSLYGVSL